MLAANLVAAAAAIDPAPIKGVKALPLAQLRSAFPVLGNPANKHRTVIGNDVHVGSNCVLVAPVTLGDGATIGGGSTISKDAPAGQLTVARAKQVSLAGWTRPTKKKT